MALAIKWVINHDMLRWWFYTVVAHHVT